MVIFERGVLKTGITFRAAPNRFLSCCAFIVEWAFPPLDWWGVVGKIGRGTVCVRAKRLGKIIFLHA